MHETRHPVVVLGIPVEVHALDEGRGAVAHADDRDTNLSHLEQPPLGPLGAADGGARGGRKEKEVYAAGSRG